MKNRFWFIRFVTVIGVGVLIGVGGQESCNGREGSPESSERNELAVFDQLLPIIYSTGKPVRLYYRSDCRRATDPLRSAVPFPFVKVQAPSKGKTALAAVRQIFDKDKNTTVMEDSTGVIRIWIGKVPTTVLETKVSRLNLDAWGRYNPIEVFKALVDAKEMQNAMRSLRFVSVYNPSSSGVEPANGYPHLAGTISNISAEQVLDRVAKTWAGEIVVIYGVCAEASESEGARRFFLGVNGQIAPRGLR